MQRAFGIITKLDLCLTPTIYQDHYDKAYQELIDKCFKPEYIYVACPRAHIIKETSEEYNVINAKFRIFGNDLALGFQRSKEALNKFIEYELPKTHLKQLVDLGRMRLDRAVAERLNHIKINQLLPQILADMSVDEYITRQKIESWDLVYDENIFQPAFAKANFWISTVITKERTEFCDGVRQTFHDTFRERTKQFIRSTQDIEQRMFEQYEYSRLQSSAHKTDDEVRQELCFQLEEIVDETSDVLAKYFHNRYVCGLEEVLYNVCPNLRNLYRTKLTLEKCTNETHALILRVCRPIITAIVRHPHSDPASRTTAINELIYTAPAVAFNIAKASGSNGVVGTDIYKSVEELASKNEMTTLIIRTLFNQ